MKFTKTIEVKNIFNKISYKYDLLNNLLSFGLHKLWKRKLVNLLEPLNGEDWADLCCGTGDLAFLISERVRSRGSITGIDSAEAILNIAKKIISGSNKNYFIDCSNKDLQGVILAIKNSDFFLGNNSGPLNLAAALGIKSFGLIANDPVSELKYSKIIPIVPKDYVDNVWHRDRNGMKNLKPDEVFNQVIENL